MRLYIIITLLVFSGTATANDWSRGDTQREIAWQAINIIDWGQTLDIIESADKYENNPLLGKHPSRSEVNLYFATGAAAHYGVSRYLSADNRQTWQWITIGFGVGTVWHNYRIGVRLAF